MDLALQCNFEQSNKSNGRSAEKKTIVNTYGVDSGMLMDF